MVKKSSPEPKKNTAMLKSKVLYAVIVVVWAGLAMLAGQYVVALILQILVGKAVGTPIWTLIFYILSYSTTIGLIIWLPSKVWQVHQDHKKASNKSENQLANDITDTSLEELGMQSWPTLVDIGLVPVAYVAYTIIGNIFQEIMKSFSWFNADQAQDVGFGYFVTGWEQLAAVIAIVFVAPVAEEIIMRGWVYGKLRRRLHVVVAMLLTSILFGALHGQWNVAVTTFVLSMILCGLREITGTIWSGILLHMLVNGIAFYILYIAAF